jgi:lysine 2,3-aminomutase
MNSENIMERSSASGSVAVASTNPVSLVYFVNQVDSAPKINGNEFPTDQTVLPFIEKNFPGTTLREWNNWHWQVKNSITNKLQLQAILGKDEEALQAMPKKHLPFRITPYFASLLSRFSSDHPLYKTMIPTREEFYSTRGEETDPLHEKQFCPVPHVVHRYPDRVLFLVTDFCAAYCRYCTRSHMVAKDKTHLSYAAWNVAIDYIARNPQIRDVLISGGDPLTMSDNRLEYLLSSLRAIKHVEIIRIGTKVPIVMPMRITKKLVGILKKHHPLFMSLHITHPDEFSVETRHAINMLADAGIPLGSQSVLLKDINDSVETFKKLTHEALKVRVRPYYLYQCDPIPGSHHFRTKVEKGLEIIKGLRGYTSGYAIPHFVIDAPGGGGKIPLLPEYVKAITDEGIVLLNYENKEFIYPDNEV